MNVGDSINPLIYYPVHTPPTLALMKMKTAGGYVDRALCRALAP